MDNLEKYIRENRPLLDEVEEPRREAIWSAMQAKWSPPAADRNGWTLQIGAYWRWSIAAGVAILISLGIWFFPVSTAPPGAGDLAEYYPALAEEERGFQSLVARKEKELQLDQLDQKIYADIFQELQLLEEVHREFRQELPLDLSEEMLLPVLMKYYERKIRILERLSREIEKRKRDEEKQREQLL